MKIYRLSILFLLAALLAVTACKKDKHSIAGCDLIHFARTNVDTFNLTYNTQHRVASFYRPNSTFEYDYSGLSGNMYFMPNDTTDVLDKHLYFDDQGRVTNITVDRTLTSFPYTGNYTLNYNSKGQLIYCKQTVYEFGQYRYYTDSLFYENDNLVTILRHYKSITDDRRTDSIHISYTNLENKAGYYMWAERDMPICTDGNETNWFGLYHVLGTTSKNLPQQWLNYSTGFLRFQLDYNFLLNADGYPEDETVNRTLNSPYIQNYKFQYSCY